MSVQVTINGESRALSDARPDWVNKSLHLDKLDGDSPCVRVTIADPKVTLTLNTLGCGRSGGGGGGGYTSEQQYIIDLWREHHLDLPDISPGNVISFLKALEREL